MSDSRAACASFAHHTDRCGEGEDRGSVYAPGRAFDHLPLLSSKAAGDVEIADRSAFQCSICAFLLGVQYHFLFVVWKDTLLAERWP